MTRISIRIFLAASLCSLACTSPLAHAQTPASSAAPELLMASNSPAETDATYSSSLPEAPDPAQAQAPAPTQESDHADPQTKRILGIIPNFRAVSANAHLPPQSVKDKFITASQDSFDYSSIVLPALLAGYDQARNNTPEFRQGGVGYGRYLWHSVVDQTSENYFVEFIVPAIAHEDTRYYTLGSGGFTKRGVYAIKHVVVTRDDAGKDVFNAGEVLGAGIAAGISNLYYPSGERTFGNTAQQWGTSVGIDALTFAFKEFWPDINHKLFHGSKPMAY